MFNVIAMICIGMVVLGGFFGVCWFVGNSLTKGKKMNTSDKIFEGTGAIAMSASILGAAWIIGWMLIHAEKFMKTTCID